MLWYFNLFFKKSWFSKTNNCSFCNKTTQDFAEFWEISGNFKAKTKTEDEGILKKGKRSSSWFLSLRIGLAGREENQIFFYTKRPSLWVGMSVGRLRKRFQTIMTGIDSRFLRKPSLLSCLQRRFIHSYIPSFIFNQRGTLISHDLALISEKERERKKRVTRGHNIVAGGWAGATKPNPHP